MVDMDYSVMCLVFGILDPVDLVRSRVSCSRMPKAQQLHIHVSYAPSTGVP